MKPYLITIAYTKAKTRKEQLAVQMLKELHLCLTTWTHSQFTTHIVSICRKANESFKQGHDIRTECILQKLTDGTLVTYVYSRECIATIHLRPVRRTIGIDISIFNQEGGEE